MNKLINPHFEHYLHDWQHKFYFLVGGYGSSKSYHTALKIVLKLLQEKRTALVVRQVFDTLRNSCFSLLCEIIDELMLDEYVSYTVSPIQIKFSNGSVILFKGMDRPEKLKSINNVTIAWLEECAELSYGGFKEILGRLRHKTLPLHFILTTNPVGKNNWVYEHFFIKLKNIPANFEQLLYERKEISVGNMYFNHSTVEDNLFVQDEYVKQLDELLEYDPDLYRIAREGKFGVCTNVVLPQFKIARHYEVIEAINNCENIVRRVGMDFGFETSYNAVVRMAIDEQSKVLYIYWEYYKNKMTDDKTALELSEFKVTKELIFADCAEPKTIMYFRQQGFKMIGAKKFQGSRLENLKKVKRFKQIICSENCINTIKELSELTYAKDKNGFIIQDKFNIDPHTLSAIWYGLEGVKI